MSAGDTSWRGIPFPLTTSVLPPHGVRALDIELCSGGRRCRSGKETRCSACTFGQCDRDGEVVPRYEAKLLQRLFLPPTCLILHLILLLPIPIHLGIAILRVGRVGFEETGGGDTDGAWFAEDVAGVDLAEVFRGEAAFGCGVGVDGAEGEAGEGVFEFGDVWGGGAEGG